MNRTRTRSIGTLAALALGAASLSACAHDSSASAAKSGSMAGMSMPGGMSMSPGASMSPGMSMAPQAAVGSGAEPASVTVGSITLTGAQVKVPVTPDETVGYLTISNSGGADELIGASSPDAQSVQLHTTKADGSVDTMEKASSIPIPAHATVEFALGGLHLMLMQPDGVHLGVRVPLLLRFRTAGVVTVWAQVSSYGTALSAPSASAS
jgi:copper(I)-binding protein